MLDNTSLEFQSRDTITPNSETEKHNVGGPVVSPLIEDDILKGTIPVVRDVVCVFRRGHVSLISQLKSIPASWSCKRARCISAARQHSGERSRSPLYYEPLDVLLIFCTCQSTSQLDARGSTFTDIGGDQHYHIHLTVCPHGASSTTRDRTEPAVCELYWLLYLSPY